LYVIMMACRRASMLLGLASLISMIAAPASATVSRLTVQSRQDVLDGRPFGAVGGYEKLVGTVEFALDPTSPANARIVDLHPAPASCVWTRPSRPMVVATSRASFAATGRRTNASPRCRSATVTTGRILSPTASIPTTC